MFPRKLAALAAVVPFALSSMAMTDGAVVEEVAYFHCADDASKLTNATIVANGPDSWDENPPERSYAQGAGCGNLDTTLEGTSQASLYDVTFAGQYEGPLDSLTVSLYGLTTDRDDSYRVTVRLNVDGIDMIAFGENQVDIHAEGTGMRPHHFSVTNIGQLDEGPHDIVLTVGTYYINHAAMWSWDTVEAPSSITFNPIEPKGPVIWAPGARRP